MSRIASALFLGGLLLAAASFSAAAPQVAEDPPANPVSYAGRALQAVLEDLQRNSIGVIFSSDLVKPTMIVEKEPTGGSVQEMLDELLGPHGLRAEVGPGGSVLVVRRPPSVVRVGISSPSSGQAVFGEIDIAAYVTADEPIEAVEFFLNGQRVGTVYEPPYRIRVHVGDRNVDRLFEVVAHGAWGAVGSDIVATREVSIQATVEVALKQLFVTVTRDSKKLLDLGRENFSVFDSGTREPLVTFERGDVPISAVLLLDASESMKGRFLQAALDGSRAFLEHMNPLDQAMVMLFSDRPLATTHFSGEKDLLLSQLEGAVASGGTALNDHLYASLRLLDRTQGRKVVILLSDGSDVLSVLQMEDILWKVRRGDALIYWIRMERPRGRSFSSAWRDFEANQGEWDKLEIAVKESGGRVEELSGAEDIQPAFKAIMNELRQQYVLGYYPKTRGRDGSWRKVRVKVDIPGTKVRFRAGYVDF